MKLCVFQRCKIIFRPEIKLPGNQGGLDAPPSYSEVAMQVTRDGIVQFWKHFFSQYFDYDCNKFSHYETWCLHCAYQWMLNFNARSKSSVVVWLALVDVIKHGYVGVPILVYIICMLYSTYKCVEWYKDYIIYFIVTYKNVLTSGVVLIFCCSNSWGVGYMNHDLNYIYIVKILYKNCI
jgi:hypothetical protein